MKKIISVAFLLFIFVGTGYAQESFFEETRDVDSFNRIYTCCGINVYITEGSSRSIRIETTHEDFLQYLNTEVRSGELRISVMNNRQNKFRNLKTNVYVSVRNLTSAKASSGGSLISNGLLKANEINLEATSGSLLKLELNAADVKCHASSGSDIILSGSATNVGLESSSGSLIKAYDLKATKAIVSASSGSTIRVWGTDELNASASSGAQIKYKGDPQKINRSSSSGGSVKKL